MREKLSYIKEIFNNISVLTIPPFQRPYVWKVKQAKELFESLATFINNNNASLAQHSPYFFGSIILSEADSSEVIIIDGQQRLITLTILIAVLRALVPSQHAQDLTSCLYENERALSPVNRRQYRLRLRDQEEQFFRIYIQDEMGIANLQALSSNKLTDSQKNIYAAASLFLHYLEQMPTEQILHFSHALLTKCFVAIITISQPEEVEQIFTRINTTGVRLSESDIAKARLLSKIPQKKKNEYAKKWEGTETKLGREEFQKFFSHLRSIYRNMEQQNYFIQSFFDELRPTIQSLQFIDKTLLSYADAFYAIKNAEYQENGNINTLLQWLNKIRHYDWIPSAMLYLSHHCDETEALIRFFTDLERLTIGLMLLGMSNKKITERHRQLLHWIEDDDDIYLPQSPLQLTTKEQRDILATLNGNLYSQSSSCLYVLLRLDAALSEGEATYKHSITTIEHVLPQNPLPNSLWTHWFPEQDKRKHYVHCLGNLVLLSRSKNSEAQNYDFKLKKQKYFATPKGVSPFALTSQVLREEEWTPAILEQRQQKLMSVLKKIWRLQ